MPQSDPPSGRPLRAVADLYAASLRDHGAAPKGVGWKSVDEQVLRFDKLVQVIPPADRGRPIRVSDFGCGYGAMCEYLAARDDLHLAAYWGCDICPEMLEEARRRLDDPRATVVQADRVTEPADYAFVSGTFNVKMDASDAEWNAFMKEVLANLDEMSERGFAFNALSTYVDWRAENLYYADPAEFFDFCKRHFSRSVALLHDYPLYEWTIYVRKDTA